MGFCILLSQRGRAVMIVSLPYGKGHMSCCLPDERVKGILKSRLGAMPARDEAELVCASMRNPLGTKPLRELAVGKKTATFIASDHTRPVPSRIIAPRILEELRLGNPDIDITILIATGCHRGTTKAELREKFGRSIVDTEQIRIL